MSAKLTRAYIALGANLGEPLKQLDIAAQALDTQAGIRTIAMSPVYQSVPHGDIEQPDYFNAVLGVDTGLTPAELLAIMQAIETENGRQRTVRWGARTLDLDLILYGDLTQDDAELTIPHPRAHQREFVVKPLYDLDKALHIPEQGRVADLLATLPLDNLVEVRHGTTYHH